MQTEGQLTLANNSQVQVNAGILALDSLATATVGSNVTFTISNTALLGLTGPVSQLNATVNIINNSAPPATVDSFQVLAGANRVVGTIAGSGTTMSDKERQPDGHIKSGRTPC